MTRFQSQELGTSKRRVECNKGVEIRQNYKPRSGADERLMFKVLVSVKRTLVILSLLKTECLEARAVYIHQLVAHARIHRSYCSFR